MKNLQDYLLDILLDADALIALAKQDDSNHERAVKINDELQKKRCLLHVISFHCG